MFCQASAGVSLRYLVHLTDQLREELDPHHAVLGTTLQELGHVTDHWEQEIVLLRPETEPDHTCSEHKLILVTVKPAQLGDPGEECHQTLDHELRQLGLGPEVVENIVPDVHPALQLQDARGATDQLGEGGGGQELRVGRTGSLQQSLTFTWRQLQ